MKLPENSDIYTNLVIQRCEDLIEGQIWSGIDLQRLEGWLSNFTTPEEKYLVARLLDSVIYRSKSQTHALITQGYTKILPQISRKLALEV
jgi:hypothetical protein